MEQWPLPANVRGFLGLTGYYRKFVQNYGTITKPLIQLLTKKCFAWTKEANAAFQQSGHDSHTSVGSTGFHCSFYYGKDTCDSGVDAVLMRKGHPIAYTSKALCIFNRNLSIYGKEFLAVIMAIDKWRQYLQRGPFTILTDYKSLCSLTDQPLTSELEKKAMSKRVSLQFEFKYKK
jgi:hypothetical protein